MERLVIECESEHIAQHTAHYPRVLSSSPSASVQGPGGGSTATVPTQEARTSSSVATWSAWDPLEEECQEVCKESWTQGSWGLASHQQVCIGPRLRWGVLLRGAPRGERGLCLFC